MIAHKLHWSNERLLAQSIIKEKGLIIDEHKNYYFSLVL